MGCGAKVPDIKNPLETRSQILGWSASTAAGMAKRFGHIRPEAQRRALARVATQEIQTGVHQFVHQAGRGLQSTLPKRMILLH